MTSSSPYLPPSKESNFATQPVDENAHHDVPTRKDWKFWCIIFSLTLNNLLTALEFSSIGTVLPTIVHELKGEQFVWVGSAYAFGSTALVPLCGGLTQIIGRRPIVLSALFLFALGSAICATASSMNILIAGRSIQGLGAGAITSTSQIILSDLVTLSERGTFSGITSLAWAIGGGVGPLIGGSLAQRGQWRWIFYLNLPICALTASLVLLFLRLKTPPATLREKLSKIDFIGNVLIIASMAAFVIGLTWGGVRYPWSSVHILMPLIFGFVGLSLFFIYEFYFCKPPVVPILLRLDWTGTSGYLQIFMMAAVAANLNWYPVFFEACKETSPTKAGIDVLGLSYSSGLFAVVAGIVVKKSGNYVIPTYVGWVLAVVGAGLLTTLHADSSMAKSIGFQIVIGSGGGAIHVTSMYPILASIPVTQTAPAMTLFVFLRSLGNMWGVTVGGAILQNELKMNLPASFIAQLPQGVEIAFSSIPNIPSLSSSLKDEVRNTFGEALNVNWKTLLGISIVGFLFSLGMRKRELHTEIDKDWGRSDVTLVSQQSTNMSGVTDSTELC
ncbi:major facilitator superfamily domain-containing protein [Lactifluus volemus]|nr:major facilitator superfamily domain-containing protein [Lactifluus volemus]